MELTRDEQADLAQFLEDLRIKVERYESAEAYDHITSVDQFSDILRKLPDRIIVVAAWDELD